MPFLKRKEYHALLSAGIQMSNICYNLRQGRDLPEHARESMAVAYSTWDKVKHAVYEAVAKRERKRKRGKGKR